MLMVLQAMRCQTSPQYPLYRYGDPAKRLSINFGGDGGFIHGLASKLLFWQDDSESCRAMNMALVDNNKLNVKGSFSIIWPFFVSLCISQFVETLACALQGRQPLPETGMTTFEHSLAFAECEAMITNALGIGFFGQSKDKPTSASKSDPGTVLLTRSMILQRLNVPSEVLLISFISCLSHLSSATLAVTGHRQRFRLVNTGIWALCYMSAFLWSFVKIIQNPLVDEGDLGILRFPTVCIIGFIPHLLILVGITVCAFIYGFALLITAISLPPDAPQNTSLKERFSIAFHNLQANVQFSSSSSIKLNWQEDFYTTLLKVGFNILTAASEAVYLNEGSRIRISEMTWLEEKRIQELSSSLVPPELIGEGIARGVDFTDVNTQSSTSGYAKERRSRTSKDSDASQVGGLDSGLGLAERRSRWQLMLEFFRGILRLLLQIEARLVLRILEKLGITRRTAWLDRYAHTADGGKGGKRSRSKAGQNSRDFYLITEDGSLKRPINSNVDVEAETRRRLRAFTPGSELNEEVVDSNLYSWWKTGGWWGDLDSSGEYKARPQDDDTTSMISMSTNASEADSDADFDSGRRTPTQEDPFPRSYSRENSLEPTNPFGLSDLARLLDPKTAQDREEAQMLSRHLQSERPMTRSQYRRRTDIEKARILPLQRYNNAENASSADFDEEKALETFILERRALAHAKNAKDNSFSRSATGGGSGVGSSWDTGAAGMGSGGPQCVVCQSSPRTIMVWPCGCLSVCDECRVGVAARNFGNCLCCRTGVVAYSRLFVP